MTDDVACPRCYETYDKTESGAMLVCSSCGCQFSQNWETAAANGKRGPLSRFLEWMYGRK